MPSNQSDSLSNSAYHQGQQQQAVYQVMAGTTQTQAIDYIQYQQNQLAELMRNQEAGMINAYRQQRPQRPPNFKQAFEEFVMNCANIGISITQICTTARSFSLILNSFPAQPYEDITKSRGLSEIRLMTHNGPVNIAPEGQAQVNWDKYMETVD